MLKEKMWMTHCLSQLNLGWMWHQQIKCRAQPYSRKDMVWPDFYDLMLDSIANQDYMSSYKLYIISHVFLMCLRTFRTLLWSVLNWWILNILKYWRSLAFLRLSGMLCLCSMEMGNIPFSLYEILAVSLLITISLPIIWQNMLIVEIALLIRIGARILLGPRACTTQRTHTMW